MSFFRSRINVLAFIIGGCLSMASVSTAYASPWTLPQHELVLSTGYRFSAASEEYLQDGQRQQFSVGGRFRSSALEVALRYGLTDKLELELSSSFKQVSYESDPVILDLVPEMLTREQARDNIIDFDTERFGASDLYLNLRYNLIRSVLMVTPEFSLKVPMGYDKPKGTFANVEEYLAGEDPSLIVEDDVSLGDGQVDARVGLLLGSFIPATKTFFRGGFSFLYRFGAPGNQIAADFKVGQFLAPKLIIFGGVRYFKTVTEGDVIGTTFVDTNPTQPARRFVFSGNVETRDLRLDRDYTMLELGTIISLGRAELQVSYEQILTGRNISKIHAFGTGVIVAIPDATAPDAPEQETAPATEEESQTEETSTPTNETNTPPPASETTQPKTTPSEAKPTEKTETP